MDIDVPKNQIDYERLKNSKLSFYRSTKAKPIFHYTSIGGLQGIFEKRKLRFTNIKYMNDKDEIVAGVDSLVKLLGMTEEKRDKMRKSSQLSGKQTFVCCFSLEGDSLPMWNYYTKEINNQGYNIEFDDKTLVESILRENPVLDGCYISFGIVDYSKDDHSEYSQIIAERSANLIGLTLSKQLLAAKDELLGIEKPSNKDFLEEWEKKIENDKKKINALPIYFYNGQKCRFAKDSTDDYLCFIKRDCFKQEREFRIVITVPNERLAELKKSKENVYQFRISNGILIPFLELKFSLKAVKSMMISPTVQSDLVERSIQDFLKYCEFDVEDYAQFIRHSTVPVRF